MPDNYVIIENTPGYLPEDDDPPKFDSYAEALNYLVQYNKDLSEELDENDNPSWDVEPIENGWFCYCEKDGRRQDPAHQFRVVEIVKVEEDD
jgi:hypothetical protein